jgi:hypothetical protein
LLRPFRLDPSSLWSDCVFPVGSVAVVAFPAGSVVPLLFCRGPAGTMIGADACAAVGLPGGAPCRLDDRRSRKVGLSVSFCCIALPIVDTRTSTPPGDQASAACLPTATTSTSATSASRGYRLLGAHTGPYSSRNIRTITMLRLGGFQPVGSYFRPLLQSHRMWCPRCDCGGC